MPPTWGFRNERFQCRLEVCFQRDIWQPGNDKSNTDNNGPAFLREGTSDMTMYSIVGTENRARVRGFQRLAIEPGAWRRNGSIQDGRLFIPMEVIQLFVSFF